MNFTVEADDFGVTEEVVGGGDGGDDGDGGAPQLYEVPPSVVALLSCLYGLISLAALVGNSLVMYVVAVAPRMRTVTNFYIANLAFADVTIALFAIPFQVRALGRHV